MSIIEKDKILGSLRDQIDTDIMKNIDALYNKIDNESEFEFMFFNYKKDQNRMGLEHFLRLLEYLTFKSQSKN